MTLLAYPFHCQKFSNLHCLVPAAGTAVVPVVKPSVGALAPASSAMVWPSQRTSLFNCLLNLWLCLVSFWHHRHWPEAIWQHLGVLSSLLLVKARGSIKTLQGGICPGQRRLEIC